MNDVRTTTYLLLMMMMMTIFSLFEVLYSCDLLGPLELIKNHHLFIQELRRVFSYIHTFSHSFIHLSYRVAYKNIYNCGVAFKQ